MTRLVFRAGRSARAPCRAASASAPFPARAAETSPAGAAVALTAGAARASRRASARGAGKAPRRGARAVEILALPTMPGLQQTAGILDPGLGETNRSPDSSWMAAADAGDRPAERPRRIGVHLDGDRLALAEEGRLGFRHRDVDEERRGLARTASSAPAARAGRRVRRAGASRRSRPPERAAASRRGAPRPTPARRARISSRLDAAWPVAAASPAARWRANSASAICSAARLPRGPPGRRRPSGRPRRHPPSRRLPRGARRSPRSLRRRRDRDPPAGTARPSPSRRIRHGTTTRRTRATAAPIATGAAGSPASPSASALVRRSA